jgi:hypothetical protein
MDKYDPATKHPKHWLAFLLCSYYIDHFTGRRLSLPSCCCCVPPPIGQPDNIKKRGAPGNSEGNSTISNSFFIHTVQLVSHRKEDEELAHIKDQETTIKEAIFTLEDLDKVGYAEDLIILRKEEAVAVLHQMKMMRQRTKQYKHNRAAEAAADNFANQLVTRQHIQSSRNTHHCPLSVLQMWMQRNILIFDSFRYPTKAHFQSFKERPYEQILTTQPKRQ